jgi:hypothetical protein
MYCVLDTIVVLTRLMEMPRHFTIAKALYLMELNIALMDVTLLQADMMTTANKVHTVR